MLKGLGRWTFPNSELFSSMLLGYPFLPWHNRSEAQALAPKIKNVEAVNRPRFFIEPPELCFMLALLLDAVQRRMLSRTLPTGHSR